MSGGLFGMSVNSVDETCSCGARFRYHGIAPYTAAAAWRRDHRCARVRAAVSDEQTVCGPEGHRDRQGRCEALDESEGEA